MLYDTCAAPSDRRSRALSDDQRVLASQRGYEGFFRATYPPLATQLHAVLGDREQAHQAAIQALRDAARRWNEVGELADPTSWVRQRAATRLRRQATLRMVTNPTAAHIPPSSDIAVLDALLSLPDVQRRALVLTYLARLPIDQVAHEESTTVAAILSRLAHATVELGHRLSRGGGARGDVDVSSGRWATTEIDDWVARQMSYLEYRLTPRPSSEPIPTVSARRWSTNASIGLLTGALAVITVGVGVAAHLRAASEASVVTPRLSATTVTPKLLVPSTAMAAGSHSPDGRAPAAPLPAAQAPAAPAPAAPVPAAPVPAAPVPAAPVPAAPAPAAPAPAAPAPAAPVPTAPAPATPAPATPAPATPAPATSTPARPAPATRAPATRVPSAALAPALPKPAVRAPAARAPVPEAPREAATGRRQAPDRTPAKTVPSDDARTE
uniref:RNA polymerase sigma factor n=1 Tax=Pseudonocardia spinosispora TaxID=103441 RepID=UPI003CCC23FB